MTEKRKLWVVTRTYVGIALAETQSEAIELADDVQKWDDCTDTAVPFDGTNTPVGWDDLSGIYRKHCGDMSFGAAKKLVGMS